MKKLLALLLLSSLVPVTWAQRVDSSLFVIADSTSKSMYIPAPWDRMTDADLERAARFLCQYRGQDPDSLITHSVVPSNPTNAVYIEKRTPQWKFARDEIKRWIADREADDAIRNAIDWVR